MNSIACALLFLATLNGPVVRLSTLDGEAASGALRNVSPEGVTIAEEGEERTISLDRLMLLQFPATDQKQGSDRKRVLLTDGSSIGFDGLLFTGREVTLDSELLGSRKLVSDRVRNIRWADVDEKVAEAWADLQSRNTRDDLLVIRKGDVLDYVAGTLTAISEEGITLNVRGRDLTAPADRVFSVVFANRTPLEQPGLGLVRTHLGDELKARTLAIDSESEQLVVTTVGGLDLQLDLSKLREIDFGGGRIRFLADLPFDESDSRSPDEDFPVVWFTARNFPAGTGGRRPLLIGDQSYQRGLWLHSGAVVRFRLSRQFREFRSVVGFDGTHQQNMPRFEPKVRLVIQGDNETLYSREFAWNDPAEKLNLDLGNVRELVIRVESLGAGKGILEHFALGEAQLIK